MIYLFYSIVCFIFVLMQTVVLPNLPGLKVFYDLGLIFVFYLSLYRPMQESLPLVLILGFVMDNLSGAPFGLYLTTYFWLFFGVKWVTHFLRVRNIVLLPFLIASGMLLKNAIFIATIAVGLNWAEFHLDIFRMVGYQLLWAVLTGPLLLVLLSRIHSRWDLWMETLFEEKDGSPEP